MLLLTILLGTALFFVEQSSMTLVLDLIAASVDAIAKASFALIGLVLLLVLTVGAGAWVTVLGIRIDTKRTRIRERRRSRA